MDIEHLVSRENADFDFSKITISRAKPDELKAISSRLGLGLSLEEMGMVCDYFNRLGREPTDLEMQAIGQAWSEHACYKTSIKYLKKYLVSIDNDDVVARGDAGVMRFQGERVYTLRIESHNHPSAIGPYGGAATGIGGIVRDVLAMGSQPIALVDPLFFGDLDIEPKDVPVGIKHPRYLFGRVVDGIRDYGNRLGIPTVTGAVYFDNDYTGNCLVNVGCVGAAREDHIMENRVKEVGDLYLLIGGKTGRDGIHGVTFASAELTEKSGDEDVGAVQLGDPITEEPVIHATLDAIDRGLVQGLKDLGGGGLSCVIGELALAAGFGAEVDLDKVPLKEENMAAWEIWISESQERMMLVVRPENLQAVMDIMDLYDVEANVVAKVIPEKQLRVTYKGKKVADVSLDFIYDAPVYDRPYILPDPKKRAKLILPKKDINITELMTILPKLLSDLNISSRDWVIRQYDHEVRAGTAIKPLQGLVSHPTHGDASVMKPFEDTKAGLALAVGTAPFVAKIDPYKAAKIAVDEMVRNLVAVGARPHSFTNCLNLGNPEKKDRMGEFVETVRGIGEVAKEFNIPTPSGNVSFYNEAIGYKVPPTAVLLGAGRMDDLANAVTSDLKVIGSHIFLVGKTTGEMGGSAYFRLMGYSSPDVPDVDAELLHRCSDAMLEANENGLLNATHDISDGGLAVAVSEMVFGSDLGVIIDLEHVYDGTLKNIVSCFSESPTRWLVEVDRENVEKFKAIMERHNVPYVDIGETVEDRIIEFRSGEKTCVLDAQNLYNAWESPLWDRM